MNYVRFVQEMDNLNIPIWGLTVQNEPAAVQNWDSCVYSAEEEKDFVKNHLGPALEENGLGHIKIIIWDHNRDKMLERARVAYSDPDAAKYIWGDGFHWYGQPSFDNVRRVHELRPDKHLIFTEGCQENGPHMGDWSVAERYGESMIKDFSNWAEGWTDWNLILDERGGPNHVQNFCSAPVIADTGSKTIYYNPSFYYIGHFSKFIQIGAKRILSGSSYELLECFSFRNSNGKITSIVMNRTGQNIRFRLLFNGLSTSLEASAHSIMTMVWREA